MLIHYIPIHIHPYYQKLGFKWGDFPQSEHTTDEQSVYQFIQRLHLKSNILLLSQLSHLAMNRGSKLALGNKFWLELWTGQ